MTIHRNDYAVKGPVKGLFCFFICFMLLFLRPCTVPAGPVDDLTIGEAFYMSGNLTEAAKKLTSAAGSKSPDQARRALYLLGRISLLTGDYRQAKEYFERSADVSGAGEAGRWMALAGIGDTLFASGHYEEAIRRYRIAMRANEPGTEAAVIGLKIALCRYSFGDEIEALDDLRVALKGIPVLTGWVGREEEFYQSMVMAGIAPGEPAQLRIYLVAGPITGDFKVDEMVGPDILVKEDRRGKKTYLQFGPLTDSVEAMILSEKIRNRYEIPVEILKK